jgi:hypothetical protein
MGRWTAQLGDERVSVDCLDGYADLVPPVLNLLTALYEHGEPMTEGLALRWGWSELVLVREADGRLQVHEPDFGDDPLESYRPDVTATLQVQAATRDVLARCGVEPHPVRFDELMVVAGDALAAPVLMAQRNKPSAPGDSGWYVGARPGFEEGRLAPRMVFELLGSRPGLLPALALPAGWQVVLDGDDILRVVDDRDRDVLRRPHA